MKNILLVSLAILFLSQCSLFDKEEDLPAFIRIDSISLNVPDTLVSLQGSDRTALEEIQVNANGQVIGIFSLPCVVPILETGEVDLILTPIINRDGVSTTKVPYPHYTSYRVTELIEELDTLVLFPEVRYVNNLNFYLEDFTASSDFENTDPNADGELVRILTEPFEPPASGFIDLPSDAQFFFAETDENFDLPLGSPVFIEMHYSSNHPFRVGITAEAGLADSSTDLVGINPTTNSEVKEWKKIYINLTDFISSVPNAESFEIYFRLSKDTNFPEPLVFLDNIKVVYPN